MKKIRLKRNCICGAQASLYYDQKSSQLVIKCRGISKDRASGRRHTLRMPVDRNKIDNEKYKNNAILYILTSWEPKEQANDGKINDSSTKET